MGNPAMEYSPEVSERAVRMFQEHMHEYPLRWAEMQSIAGNIGCTAETLRSWVPRRRNAALAERERLKQHECRQVNLA